MQGEKDQKEPEKITQWISGMSAGRTAAVVGTLLEAIRDGKTVKVVCEDDKVEMIEGMGIPEDCIQPMSKVCHERTQTKLDISERELYLQIPKPIRPGIPYEPKIVYPKLEGGDEEDEEDEETT
ncbi:MAG: hypothetical protein ACW99G_01520 [Candidatus Thorarchaeota archaeon]|jgi:hypothetical protein